MSSAVFEQNRELIGRVREQLLDEGCGRSPTYFDSPEHSPEPPEHSPEELKA